jgi:hypothetical protein
MERNKGGILIVAGDFTALIQADHGGGSVNDD